MLGTSCPPTPPSLCLFALEQGWFTVQLTFDLRWGRVLLQLDGDDLLDNPGEAQSAFYEGPGVSGSGAGGGLQAPSHLPNRPQRKPVGRRPQGRREGSCDTHPHDALCWAESGRQSESRVGEVGPLLLEHPGWALAWGGALGVSNAELFWGVEADAGSGVHQGILLWEQALEACPCSAVGG